MSDPRDLDAIEDPYPGFAEDRDLLKRALGRLDVPVLELWRQQVTRMQGSTRLLQASDDEVIEETMLMLLKWLRQHPRLQE